MVALQLKKVPTCPQIIPWGSLSKEWMKKVSHLSLRLILHEQVINIFKMLLIKLTWKLSVGYQLYEVDSQVNGETSTSAQGETVWVEGLVPGIDFCNHGM